MPELRWETPTRRHDAEWAALLGAIEAVDQTGETYDAADLDDEWASVWASPSTDATFVWDGPRLVAFGWLKVQPGTNGPHRVSCWGGVDPARRRQGIGSALLRWQVERAQAVVADLDPSRPATILLDVGDGQADLDVLATAAGFEPVRRFLTLARPTSLPVAPRPVPAGLTLAEWDEGIDGAVRAAHAVAFADHWGSEPRTEEEWRQWYTGHRSFRPALSAVAVDEADGTVAAYVLTAAYPQDWASQPREAWITSVGTRPGWRGRGVAQWLLSEVLGRVAASPVGFEQATLNVDAENTTGALPLYRRLGFEDVRGVTMWALAVPSAA